MSVKPDLDSITLRKGKHESREEGVCAMELVAWLAGQPHTDYPQCVSPVLAAFVRRWNDDLDDQTRQQLKPYLPRLIGTAGDGADQRRSWLAIDWLMRVYAPTWLDLADLIEHATRLRALPEIDSPQAASDALPSINRAQAAARVAAGTAARVAAWSAGTAARVAAWSAGTAAWVAAGAAGAVGVAAWSAGAAAGAAGAAAWAAGAAAGVRLGPTVISLQRSGFDLLDRMIEAGRHA